MISYGKIKDLYSKLPSWTKIPLGWITIFIPIQYLYGKGFREFYNLSLKSQYWTREQIIANQEKLLRKLMIHAYKNVPYYAKLFVKLKLKPSAIRTVGDLYKLPTLTKEDIRNNFQDLRANNIKFFKASLASTSGSTGKKLSFYIDQQNREKEYALVQRQLNIFNIKLNVKTANFRGDFVNLFDKKSSKKWGYNPIKKEMLFSTYNLDPETISEYVKVLQDFKPSLVKGYPSAIFIIAKSINKNNLKPPIVKGILTSSEMLTYEMRDEIDKAFNSKIIDWYGASEYSISAGQCEKLNGFHFNEDFSIVELLDRNDKPIKPGEIGRIISTSLFNYSMPLIRYEQEDLAVLSKNRCSCGRNLTFIDRIGGRVADVLFASDGREISHSAYLHFWKHRIDSQISGIEYSQTIQKEKNLFEIHLVLDHNCDNDMITDTISKYVKKLTGSDSKIQFKIFENMPTNEKWRFIKNEWKK